MCSRRIAGIAVFAVAAAASAGALAQLTTIHEAGPTVPIAEYLAPTLSPGSPSATPTPPATTALPAAFPVSTASMRPGQLTNTQQLRIPAPLPAPLFIVGDDPLSRRWLSHNAERLRRSGANGLVINVETLAAFQSLRALAPGVPMAPAPADDLARQAGLSTYPLFVARDGRVSPQVP